MALVTLAVYAYVEELKGFYDDLGLRTFEWATDFSYRWYQQVGASIVLTLCASAATKPLQGYFSHWWHFMWRQSRVTRRAVPVRGASATRFVRKTVLRKRYAKLTQNECDRIFIGPRFLLSERFGEILSMWLACLIFSSGMPFMYVVFFMYIALQVLMDRVLLLRVCRRPAQYDDKLGIQFLKYDHHAAPVRATGGVRARRIDRAVGARDRRRPPVGVRADAAPPVDARDPHAIVRQVPPHRPPAQDGLRLLDVLGPARVVHHRGPPQRVRGHHRRRLGRLPGPRAQGERVHPVPRCVRGRRPAAIGRAPDGPGAHRG